MGNVINYNGYSLFYKVHYKDVKNINIRVQPTGEIVVSCNSNIDDATIKFEIIKRAKWIIKTIKNFERNLIIFEDINLKFVDGEAFTLLGKTVQIKNVYTDVFGVDYDNNYLYISRKDNKGVKLQFQQWYKKFTEQHFAQEIDKAFLKFEKYGISKPIVKIKNMRTRWGTCNIDKGIITLNRQLIKVDTFLLEYVICHELTHLKYRSHNKDFYSYLTAIIPDWNKRDTTLNNTFIEKTGGKL